MSRECVMKWRNFRHSAHKLMRCDCARSWVRPGRSMETTSKPVARLCCVQDLNFKFRPNAEMVSNNE